MVIAFIVSLLFARGEFPAMYDVIIIGALVSILECMREIYKLKDKMKKEE